jgi:hypothetical protein
VDPVANVPTWHALLAELAAAPSDPVVTPPKRSLAWLWALWLILTGLLFVPVVLSFSGRSLPVEITNAFPWILLPIVLVAGAVVAVMQARALRAHNADLALFGFAAVEPSSLLARLTGQYQLTGRRWGRPVWVLLEKPTRRIGPSVVSVGAPSPSFELVGQGVQLFAKPGPPAPLLGFLATVCPAGPWDGVTVTAGPDGIIVRRRALWTPLPDVERERRWLYDLWLAERLATALTTHR